MVPQCFLCPTANFAADGWETKALVSLVAVASREAIIDPIDLQHINRYLEADDTDTVHEFLHLDWIIGPRSHQWPPDLVQWNFHYHWALLLRICCQGWHYCTVGGGSGERQIPAPRSARAPSPSWSEGGVRDRAAGEEGAGAHRQIQGRTRRHGCRAAARSVAGPRREAVACQSVASMCTTRVIWARC